MEHRAITGVRKPPKNVNKPDGSGGSQNSNNGEAPRKSYACVARSSHAPDVVPPIAAAPLSPPLRSRKYNVPIGYERMQWQLYQQGLQESITTDVTTPNRQKQISNIFNTTVIQKPSTSISMPTIQRGSCTSSRTNRQLLSAIPDTANTQSTSNICNMSTIQSSSNTHELTNIQRASNIRSTSSVQRTSTNPSTSSFRITPNVQSTPNIQRLPNVYNPPTSTTQPQLSTSVQQLFEQYKQLQIMQANEVNRQLEEHRQMQVTNEMQRNPQNWEHRYAASSTSQQNVASSNPNGSALASSWAYIQDAGWSPLPMQQSGLVSNMSQPSMQNQQMGAASNSRVNREQQKKHLHQHILTQAAATTRAQRDSSLRLSPPGDYYHPSTSFDIPEINIYYPEVQPRYPIGVPMTTTYGYRNNMPTSTTHGYGYNIGASTAHGYGYNMPITTNHGYGYYMPMTTNDGQVFTPNHAFANDGFAYNMPMTTIDNQGINMPMTTDQSLWYNLPMPATHCYNCNEPIVTCLDPSYAMPLTTSYNYSYNVPMASTHGYYYDVSLQQPQLQNYGLNVPINLEVPPPTAQPQQVPLYYPDEYYLMQQIQNLNAEDRARISHWNYGPRQ